MNGRGAISVETGSDGHVGEINLDASFGDYGRNDNPSLSAQAGGATFTFEFASPDAARLIAERLLDLARKAEVKMGQRGPEYRAQLAREEALTDIRSAVARFEAAMGVPASQSQIEPRNVMTTVFGEDKRAARTQS